MNSFVKRPIPLCPSALSLAALVLSTLLFAACQPSVANEPVRSPAKATSTPTTTAGTGDSQVGYRKVMASRTIDGQFIQSEPRATAMVFFASWCGPCRKELGELGEMQAKYRDLRIIGLNAYEDFHSYSDEQKLRAFVAANAPWMTEIVHADDEMLAHFGHVPRIPTLFVYDAQGLVVAEFRRDKRPPPSLAELEAAIVTAR
jgi:thiol-disulfide isomerase/thioredoxin